MPKKTEKPVCKQVTRGLMSNVMQAMESMSMLPGNIDPPFWIDGEGPFPANETLPMRNALVHLPGVTTGDMVDPQKFVMAPTPRFFSMYALDFDFDLDPPIPTEFIKFLASIWPDDAESINALQEWMGYCLLPDTRQQKIGLFIGPMRSGRGTLARLMTALIGPANVAAPRLSALATNFGLQPMIDKPLAIVGDARISGRTDTGVIVEALLSISGEDTITIDRKNKDAWTGKLPTRLMLLSNELPRLPDQSGALASRFIVWKFTRSFLGQEDLGLDARLAAELPGILLWAIEGWKRLRDRGHFHQPASGSDLVDEVRDIGSPVGKFIRERCEIDPDAEIDVAELFAEWCGWCEARRLPTRDESVFGRNLRAVVPALKTKTRRKNGTRMRCFAGIGLKKPDGDTG